MKNTQFQILILVIGIVIAMLKFILYDYTQSQSILSDALESIVNIIAGSFTLYSIYLSGKPADREHPYGHGKIENVAAGLEGGLLILAGLVMVYEVIRSYYFDRHLMIELTDTLYISALGLINYLLGVWSAHQSQKTNSASLAASATHLKSDGYSSFAMMLGLILVIVTKQLWIDLMIGFIFALFMIYQGQKIVRNSIDSVMDTADIETLDQMISYLAQYRKPQWIDIHNLRIQKFGADFHIDAHVTMPWYIDNREVHNEMKAINQLINQFFGRSVEVFIHPDPCEPICCSLCNITNCDQRQYDFVELQEWKLSNVLENQKHTRSHTE